MSLDYRCEVCGAKRGEPCVWPLDRTDGKRVPLISDFGEHFARVLPPGRGKVREKPNEAAF